MPKPRSEKTKSGGQLELPRIHGRGGKRPGAGRKPEDATRLPSVPHVKRPLQKARHPVHVTLRAVPGLPSFRQPRVHRLFAEVVRDQRRRSYRSTFRVLHWSLQTNHVHLILEADTESSENHRPLRAGVSGLEIAFARRFNRTFGRKGKVWAGRYHRHDLESPTEARMAFSYVFDNHRRHGVEIEGAVDEFSSASMFHGWDGEPFVPDDRARARWPTCSAQTWLATEGVVLAGPLPLVRTAAAPPKRRRRREPRRQR